MIKDPMDDEIAMFLKDGPLKGMEQFLLPHYVEFAHWLPNGESHLIRTRVIYTKRKKSFVFCRQHSEYIDVSVPEKESIPAEGRQTK